jgi:hypothetical protein
MPTTRVPFGQRTLVSTTPDPAPTKPFDLAAHMATASVDPSPVGVTPGTVGVITGELLRYSAFWRSVASLEKPPGSAFAQKSGLSIVENRNHLANDLHGDWLFCLDDDLVLPPRTLTRLLAHLEHGPFDVVAAHSLRRNPPFDALVYLDGVDSPDCRPWAPDGRTGLLEIAACGLGGVLIHRRVFDALERPYFRMGQIHPEHFHEDVEFCQRVRAAGFRIAVDLDTPVGHVTPMAVWPARDQDGAHCVALAGVGGEIVPVAAASLANLQVRPGLIGGG